MRCLGFPKPQLVRHPERHPRWCDDRRGAAATVPVPVFWSQVRPSSRLVCTLPRGPTNQLGPGLGRRVKARANREPTIYGFLGGGVAFIGIAFGAAAFLGFFFSLVRALLPFPIVVTSFLE